MKIVISPYSRAMRNGKPNPKNYPYWKELVAGLKEKGFHVIQIGTKGEAVIEGVDEVAFDKPLKELKTVVETCDKWISVDNFFQHFCYLHKKPGVALFGQSNPKIFGHSINKNLLKDSKYLRPKQFDIWEAAEVIDESFVDAQTVIAAVLEN